MKGLFRISRALVSGAATKRNSKRYSERHLLARSRAASNELAPTSGPINAHASRQSQADTRLRSHQGVHDPRVRGAGEPAIAAIKNNMIEKIDST
jgi:hypothetical protein